MLLQKEFPVDTETGPVAFEAKVHPLPPVFDDGSVDVDVLPAGQQESLKPPPGTLVPFFGCL
jgi:hypothetical protein